MKTKWKQGETKMTEKGTEEGVPCLLGAEGVSPLHLSVLGSRCHHDIPARFLFFFELNIVLFKSSKATRRHDIWYQGTVSVVTVSGDSEVGNLA